MQDLLADGNAFDRMLGNYDPPQGNPPFREAVAQLLRREYGWEVGPEHIAVTSGGQTAFFYLFNLLAGEFSNGRRRKILLPLCPEYIGYAEQGLTADLFVSCRPEIQFPEGEAGHRFKYVIDFPAVEAALDREDIAAIAVSRPTNPTGNVITDGEVSRLAELAAARDIPLILDNAYGLPFPGVVFTEATPYFDSRTILTLSLSKLGLPGTRTGIVVAPPEIASALGSMTAITGLANGNLGQQMVLPWLQSGEILKFGREILRPFYEARSLAIQQHMQEIFDRQGLKWYLHASEGAFFHWLWLPELPMPTREFYERLKARQVLVVPGEYFFFGLPEDWSHSRQCIRLNFSQPEEKVLAALKIIAAVASDQSSDN
jgi:valine--pyruvate aminotransferase